MSDTQTFEISLEQVDDFEFRIRFDGTELDDLATDESAPMGHNAGPNPARLLLTSVANCLAASLLYSLRKFKNDPSKIKATASASMERNDDKRWRITGMQVDLQLADVAEAIKHLPRILDQFEDFCIVTESVRSGIPVAVAVHDGDGAEILATSASS